MDTNYYHSLKQFVQNTDSFTNETPLDEAAFFVSGLL